MTKLIPIKSSDPNMTGVSVECTHTIHKGMTALFLMSNGNSLLQKERDVLSAASKHMVDALMTPKTERLAIPLPTGFGKSTLILQLIKLIHDHSLDVKLLVCVASNTELIGDTEYPVEPKGILGTLRDIGVTPDTVGVSMGLDYPHGAWDTC